MSQEETLRLRFNLPMNCSKCLALKLSHSRQSFKQKDFIFVAGITNASKEPEAAKSLIQFLTAPAALLVIRAKHLEPG